eukprot:COSAG06_NODE_5328_length_3552_cov_5.076417_4_plen_94_part_00
MSQHEIKRDETVLRREKREDTRLVWIYAYALAYRCAVSQRVAPVAANGTPPAAAFAACRCLMPLQSSGWLGSTLRGSGDVIAPSQSCDPRGQP